MDIVVPDLDVVPRNFVGHVVFYQGGSVVVGHCFEHEIIVQAPTLDQAHKQMRKMIQKLYEMATKTEGRRVRCVNLSVEQIDDVLRAAPCDIFRYRVRERGAKKTEPYGPAYSVGELVRCAMTRERAA